MLVQNQQIAIVGGGPGGLTLARLLQIKGAEVKVYERDAGPHVRVQGATLDLHEESGLEALRRAGLMEAFREHYRPLAGRMRICDSNGHIHLDDHTGEKGYAEDRPEIDRGPLRHILLQSLTADTLVWDAHFVSMESTGSGHTLHFKNGSTAYADIVIAADGANSRIRPYISNTAPLYSGLSIVEGNIYNAAHNAPQLWELCKGGKVFAFGEEQSLILSAKGEGSLSFYTGSKVPEDWADTCDVDFGSRDAVKDWFIQHFSSWSPLWLELFLSDEAWYMPRPQYHYPLDQYWTPQANITLLGDAAHRMPPYAGEGVNMAMQDAYELAEWLCDSKANSIEEAIAAYEKGMRSRCAEITDFTLRNTVMLHSKGAIDKMLAMMGGTN